MKPAHAFPGLYDDLGVGYDLGCLMLDTEKPYGDLDVNPADEYKPNDPTMKYVNGLNKDWHVTVKYGLLENVRKRHVDQVIEGMPFPTALSVVEYVVFPGSNGEYEYVLAKVDDARLRDLNKQLHVLPNVDTFVDYMPHITVGYFRPGWFEENKHQLLVPGNKLVNVHGFNYGKKLLEP